MSITSKQKQLIRTFFPNIYVPEDNQIDSLFKALVDKVQTVKGEKGEDGYSPIKGKDYWTDEELNKVIAYILKVATPIKGEHYKDGENYILTSKDKKEIAQSIEVPIVEKIIEKETIKEVIPKLHVSMVKGAVSEKDLLAKEKKLLDGMATVDGRIKLIDQRWHGGLTKVIHDTTLSGDGTGSNPLTVVSVSGSIITLTGTIDDSNVTFTCTSEPSEVVINGAAYISTGGAITWSYSSGTVTLSVPVGLGGSIYGRR